ncbi:MAG: hypothetical protein PHN75_21245 [Syntrophales bacterium]|nr:hypothetical protein [Syntrophales bacterium]
MICSYRYCRAEFEPKKKGQRFHTKTCRMREWGLLHPRLGKGLDAILPQSKNGKPHCGNPGKSQRLMKTWNVFLRVKEPTTLQIQDATGSMKPSTDVDDLRRAGYPVSKAIFVRTTDQGRKIFMYRRTDHA